MHLLPHSVSAVLGLDDRLVEKIGKIVDVTIGAKDHVAAAAAVAAIRSAFRHKLLSPKTDRPAAAVSGLRKNFDSIDKHGLASLNRYIVEPLKRPAVKLYSE